MTNTMQHTQAVDAGWIDISVPVRPEMVVWPGDPGVVIERVSDMAQGARNNLSHLSLGAHTGTHMDAPLHFLADGESIDRMPLDATVGPARVIEIVDPESIRPEALEDKAIGPGERVLFKTRNSERCWASRTFVKDFVYITPEAAQWLGRRGVRCVGIDYLSVGGFQRGSDLTHRALAGAGIWIIEGLDLSRVGPGEYDLVCLPLRLAGAEGSPARAIVRPRGTAAA